MNHSHQIAHNVYFTLKDNSPEAQQKLIEACKKYLTDHPGTVYFGAGILTDELARPVNDRDFHVALHVIFDSLESQNAYQVAERHLQFIEENKENWEKVRVFDSTVGN